MNKAGIDITFNQYHFHLFCNYFDMKNNEKFCYVYTVDKTPKYSYSIRAIDFIVDEFLKDPEHIIDNLKKKLSEENK